MGRRVPRVARRTVVAVEAGAAKGELDHLRLAGGGANLLAQRRDEGAIAFPWIGGQAAARPGKARKTFGREQVLDRDRYALQRPGDRPGRERLVRGLGDGSRTVRRPQKVGVQPLAKLVMSC